MFLCYGARLNKWVLQTYHPEYMKSPLVYHPGHRARAWRFVTYMFMHVGYVSLGFQSPFSTCTPCPLTRKAFALPEVWERQDTHLITPLQCSFVARLEQLGFNALLQLMIGVPLEMVHGVLRISLLYLAGVLAGETSTGGWVSCLPHLVK